MFPQMIPRHKFSKNSEPELLEFLKTARLQNGKNCDPVQAKIWQKILPMDKELEEKLNRYMNQEDPNIIRISDSEDDVTNDPPVEKCEDNTEIQIHNQTLIGETTINMDTLSLSETEDLCAAIRENLELEKNVSTNVLTDLKKCSKEQIEEIFKLLEDLDMENVVHFGKSISSMGIREDNLVLTYYIRSLLVSKVNQEFNTSLQKLLSEFCIHYSTTVRTQMLEALSYTGKVNEKVISQYISSLPVDYKVNFVRELISASEKLQETHILIIEDLISNQLEFNVLRKLVELMSNSADEFSSFKPYGKLLFNIVQILGGKVVSLEQPLKHIIGIHKSVWKLKVKKVFDSHFNDSLLLTQTMHF